MTSQVRFAIIHSTVLNAGVAQLAEQLICNQQVAGSSPITSSSTDSCRDHGGVPEWPKGADCKSAVARLRWFESISPTTSEQAMYRLLRLFYKVRARSRRCSSFSAKSHARLACSVVYALATARCRYQLFASCGFFVFFAFFVVESLDMQFVCEAFYVYVLVLAFKMHLFSQYPPRRSKLCIACS